MSCAITPPAAQTVHGATVGTLARQEALLQTVWRSREVGMEMSNASCRQARHGLCLLHMSNHKLIFSVTGSLLLLKVARWSDRSAHVHAEALALATICNRSAGSIDDLIPWSGRPFMVFINGAHVAAVAQQRLPVNSIAVHNTLQHALNAIVRTQMREAQLIFARRSATARHTFQEADTATVRNLLRWAAFVAINPIEDLQLRLLKHGGVAIIDPEGVGPPVTANSNTTIPWQLRPDKAMQRPATVGYLQSLARLAVDLPEIAGTPERQAYVARRQHTQMVTLALAVLLFSAGAYAALNATLCHSLSCDLGCALVESPPRLAHDALHRIGTPEARTVKRLLRQTFGPPPPLRKAKEGCGACANRPAGRHERRVCETGAEHELVDERVLLCWAEAHNVIGWLPTRFPPELQSHLAASMARCRVGDDSRCICSKGHGRGSLAQCNMSRSCGERMVALSALAFARSGRPSWPSLAPWSTWLSRWYGAALVSSMEPPGQTHAVLDR